MPRGHGRLDLNVWRCVDWRANGALPAWRSALTLRRLIWRGGCPDLRLIRASGVTKASIYDSRKTTQCMVVSLRQQQQQPLLVLLKLHWWLSDGHPLRTKRVVSGGDSGAMLRIKEEQRTNWVVLPCYELQSLYSLALTSNICYIGEKTLEQGEKTLSLTL
jgi:hypothetical protein